MWNRHALSVSRTRLRYHGNPHSSYTCPLHGRCLHRCTVIDITFQAIIISRTHLYSFFDNSAPHIPLTLVSRCLSLYPRPPPGLLNVRYYLYVCTLQSEALLLQRGAPPSRSTAPSFHVTFWGQHTRNDYDFTASCDPGTLTHWINCCNIWGTTYYSFRHLNTCGFSSKCYHFNCF